MFGSGFGFVLNQPALATGSGGGGGTTYFADRFELVRTVAFSAGLVLVLANAPFDPDNFLLFYNGVKVRPGAGGFSLSGTNVTVDFSDDPTTYDNGQVVFEAYYLFT